MNFQQRLLRDMKASAGKTAVLAVLLLVGLCFWVPPLVRAFGSSPAVAASATSATATPGASTATSATQGEANKTLAKKTFESAALARALKECPQLQPANIENLPASPFGVDEDQFPLPVLFAEEDDVASKIVKASESKPMTATVEGLVLKSTIVGSQRRAAWINNRMYQEGQELVWNGASLRLSNVQSKSVTLTDGLQEWQLKLNDARDQH